MQLDVVTELVLHRHVVGEHRDLVAAGILGGQDSLVGAPQQVRGRIDTRRALCHTDTHGAGEYLAVDRDLFAQCGLQLMSQCGGSGFVHRRAGNHDEFVAAQPGDQVLPVTGPAQALGQHADEPVARGVSEVVVDRLQPVQIEEQCRDRTRLAGRKSFVQVRQQGAPVVQTGQVIVFGKVTKPLFGQHPGLNLGEQRRDRLQCV